jgi:hypothetical protein
MSREGLLEDRGVIIGSDSVSGERLLRLRRLGSNFSSSLLSLVLSEIDRMLPLMLGAGVDVGVENVVGTLIAIGSGHSWSFLLNPRYLSLEEI